MTETRSPLLRVQSYAILALIGWTAISFGLAWLNWDWAQDNIIAIARAEARASIDKDILYRSWNALHGGVYVPVTEDTQPNPYLLVPERDVTTTTGRALTLINPAYMTRQVYELQEATGIHARLTSLKPYNPNNTADAWETSALQKFETGITEVNSVEPIDGEEHMRVMRAFITQEACLKCHAAQGYKVGDVRGGLSVSMPMSAYAGIQTSSTQIIVFGYGSLWLAGLVALYFGFKNLKKGFQEREEMMSSLQKNYEQMTASEEKFLKMFQSSPAMVTLSALEDGRYLDVNKKFLQVSGFSREEVIGKTSVELGWISAADRERLKRELLEFSFVKDMAISLRAKDGKQINSIYSGDLIQLEGKTLLLSLAQDVTEQKEAQDSLLASEERFRTLVTSTDDIVFTLDTSERHTGIFGKWMEKANIAPEFFIGRTSVEIMGEEAGLPHYEANLRALQGENVVYEWQSVDDKNAVTYYQTSLSPLYDESGNVTGLVGIGHDITQIKIFENKLRASEQQYRLLFQEMMDGFALHEIICDENGRPIDYRFLALNPAFETMTGLKKEDLIGKTVLEALPNTESHWIERYGQVALTGQADFFEEFSVALNAHYEVRAFSPTLGKFAVVFHDVSQRRHTENIMMARMKFIEIAANGSIDNLTQTIIDETEALTSSSIGFYHFVEADQTTLTLQNWSTRTLKEFCHTEGKGIHYGMDKAGIWADCAREKKPVVHNDYAAMLHRKGLPEGHAEIKRELVVPVMRHNKVVAILGVGNKAADYTSKDVELVQRIADISMEIVERKRAEDALKKNEDLLLQAQQVAHLGYYQLNIESGFWDSSGILNHIFGIDEHYVKSVQGWAEIVHPDEREEMSAYFANEVLGKKQPFDREYRIQRIEDQQTRWVHGMGELRFDAQGNPIRMVGTIQDITERKQAEEKLKQSHALLANLARLVPGVIYQYRLYPDGRSAFPYASPGINDIYEVTPEEVREDATLVFERLHPDDLERVSAEIYESARVLNIFYSEFRVVLPRQGLRWRWSQAHPERLPDGSVLWHGVISDITEQKKAEREISEKNKELEALFKISSHLRTAQTAQEMIPVVLEQMAQTIHSDANALVLLDASQTRFNYIMGDGLLAANTGLQFNMENSISGRVMKTLEPYITTDFANDPLRSLALSNVEKVGPAVLVPLQSEAEFIGTLLCARAKNSTIGEFTPAEIKLILAIGEMVGTALRRANLYEDALSRMQRVQALRSIDAAINSSMDSIITLRVLVNQILSLMQIDAAAVLLYNPAAQMLEFATANGFQYKDIENTREKLMRGFANTAILERRLVKIPDLAQCEDSAYRDIALKEGFVSCYITPMIAKGQVCGLLEAYSRSPLTPNQEWLDFLEALGGQAAIAINNAQLFNNLEKSNLELSLAYDATIEGWSQALELRDKETEGHSLRVTAWTVELAKSAGLSETELTHVRRGALLHDIGKMGVPDHILNKTGSLTPSEWKVMRQHPQYAYNMLHPVAFLRTAMDIPYSHHEHWDGDGYPQRLKGAQIPYAARLFSIIDVWDALTSNRPYRKAWSFEKALTYIQSESGKLFDPQVVELFIKNIERFTRNEASESR